MNKRTRLFSFIGLISAVALATANAGIPNAGDYSDDSVTINSTMTWAQDSFVGDSGNNNTLTVQTESGNLTIDGYLRVGSDGGQNNTMDILSGGTVSTTGYVATGFLDADTDFNTINVDGNNSTLNVGSFILHGRFGNENTFNVTNGAILDVGTNFYIGHEAGARQNKFVMDNGTATVGGNYAMGNNDGSDSNTATLTNSTLTVNGFMHIGQVADHNQVTVIDSTLTVKGDVFRVGNGSHNELSVQSGGLVVLERVTGDSNLYIGSASGANNNTVTVNGGTLRANATTLARIRSGIGGTDSGDNTLAVTGGGKVYGVRGEFGHDAGSQNSNVTVTGTNSTMHFDNYLQIGVGASDTHLMIDDGGKVSTGSYFSTGFTAGSDNNTITVNGTGSELSSAGTSFHGRFGNGNEMTVRNGGSVSVTGDFRMGQEGGANNTLTIESGGSMGATGSLDFGNGTGGSNQTVTVTGGTSSMTVNRIYIGPGTAGTGGHEITVSDGATAEVGTWIRIGGQSGLGASDNNLVRVTGEGSRLVLTNATNATTHISVNGTNNILQVDTGGTVEGGGIIVGAGGTLLLDNGEVDVTTAGGTGGVVVSTGGAITGSGTITGNAGVSGVLSPGNSTGTLTFTGTLTLHDTSEVQIQLGAGGNSDLIAAGSMTIESGSTLVLSLANGYELVGGESYTILDISDPIAGTFDTINDSALNLDPEWYVDTSDLYTLGEVTIIPEPHTMGLILLGLGAVALRRRMRKA